ncbi:MAG: acyl-CoA dehydratase activase-related protein, partial [bacterium]|nr:acyl-CoA dehydratase activase-related protein [bacterium]
PTIDKRNSLIGFFKSFLEVGKLFTKNTLKIIYAYREGLRALKVYNEELKKGITPLEILDGRNYKRDNFKVKIGIVGHCYEIYDEFVSGGMIKILNSLGVKVLSMEMVDWRTILREADVLPKKLFWTFGRELYGTARYFIRKKLIDGIIMVVAFGCGPDSLVRELIERDLTRPIDFPEITITVDEHSSELGLITRIEAFVDMLIRRKHYEDNLSSVW